jgi:phosphinothricin acetyltransferase
LKPPEWAEWDTKHRPDCRLVAKKWLIKVVGWTALSPVSSRAVYAGVVEEDVYITSAVRGKDGGAKLLYIFW